MTLRLLHLSDLHFGPPHLARVAESARRFAAEWKPDVIVASGDFTQRAKAAQFEQARAWLDSLPPVPIVTTVGNHDVPLYRVVERIFQPFQLYSHWIRNELDHVTTLNGATIVSLCSAAPRRAIVNGHISQSQVDFARRAFLAAAPGNLRVLVTHHQLAPAPDLIADQIMPHLSARVRAFADMGVDIALAGHLHRGYVASSMDVSPEQNGAAFVVAQAGTATSSRGRGRERGQNSFNTLEVDHDVCRVTRFMHSASTDTFLPVAEHRFPRSPAQALAP